MMNLRYMDKDQLIILFFVMKLCMCVCIYVSIYICVALWSCYICILLFRPCCMQGISINSWKESSRFSINRTSQNMVYLNTSKYSLLHLQNIWLLHMFNSIHKRFLLLIYISKYIVYQITTLFYSLELLW